MRALCPPSGGQLAGATAFNPPASLEAEVPLLPSRVQVSQLAQQPTPPEQEPHRAGVRGAHLPLPTSEPTSSPQAKLCLSPGRKQAHQGLWPVSGWPPWAGTLGAERSHRQGVALRNVGCACSARFLFHGIGSLSWCAPSYLVHWGQAPQAFVPGPHPGRLCAHCLLCAPKARPHCQMGGHLNPSVCGKGNLSPGRQVWTLVNQAQLGNLDDNWTMKTYSGLQSCLWPQNFFHEV